MLLTITTSPGVRGIAVTTSDRILAIHLYAGGFYGAVVSRGRECLLEGVEYRKAAWLITRLMDRVGELAKSRYYTYTGPLELGEVLRYRPYVTPTSTVEIVIERNKAVVYGGDFKKRYRTGLDLVYVFKKGVELMERCEETRLYDR
ncbi:MAG: hypothetical protein ACK4M3_08205 [Pyrobaculum sp.]